MNGYGYRSSSGCGAWAWLVGLLILLLIGGGFLLAGSELSDPSRARAEADKLNAETEAIRAQTAYEEHRQQLELHAAEEQAAHEKQLHEIQLQKEARRAAAEVQADQRLQAIWAGFWENVTNISLVVFPIAVAVLVGVYSYYLITKTNTPRRERKPREEAQVTQRLTSASQSVDRRSVPPVNNATVIQRANIQDNHPSYDGLLAFWVDFTASMQEALVVSRDCARPDPQRAYYLGGIESEVAIAYLLALRRARIVAVEVNGRLEWTRQRAIEGVDSIALRISRQSFEKFLRDYLTSDLKELERLLAQSNRYVSEAVYSVEMEPAYALA